MQQLTPPGAWEPAPPDNDAFSCATNFLISSLLQQLILSSRFVLDRIFAIYTLPPRHAKFIHVLIHQLGRRGAGLIGLTLTDFRLRLCQRHLTLHHLLP